jgi:putative hemolysin
VRPEIVAGDLSALPRSGPLLVLANHPFGILDGLLVGHLVATQRRDVKIMTHSLLCQPDEARDVLLPVDFGPGEEARRTSAETRRRAAEWLEQGHALIVFPAGSVSTAAGPFDRNAVDGAWHPFVGRLSQRRGVRTVVMFLHGQNSRLFQLASHASYPLRVALILRETAARVGGRIAVSVGAPMEAGDLPDGEGRAGLAAALRRLCYAQAGPGGPDAERVFVWPEYIRW